MHDYMDPQTHEHISTWDKIKLNSVFILPISIFSKECEISEFGFLKIEHLIWML